MKIKVLDLIAKLVKDPAHKVSHGDYEELCQMFEINSYCGWWPNGSETRIHGYHLTKWYCTDTYVGTVVWFLDDEPFAVSHQPFRKSDATYWFINQEQVDRVHKFMLSIQEPTEPKCDILDPETVMEDFFTVEYTSQLLVYEGTHKGRHCKIVSRREAKDLYGISRTMPVTYEDGTTEEIVTNTFHIPLCCIPQEEEGPK
jgi:hypothetical protein